LPSTDGAVSEVQTSLPTVQLREGAVQPVVDALVQLGEPSIDSEPLEQDQVTLPVVGLLESVSVTDWLLESAVGVESAVHVLPPLLHVLDGGVQLPAGKAQVGLPTIPNDPLVQR
jgi:hypothetical protein